MTSLVVTPLLNSDGKILYSNIPAAAGLTYNKNPTMKSITDRAFNEMYV